MSNNNNKNSSPNSNGSPNSNRSNRSRPHIRRRPTSSSDSLFYNKNIHASNTNSNINSTSHAHGHAHNSNSTSPNITKGINTNTSTSTYMNTSTNTSTGIGGRIKSISSKSISKYNEYDDIDTNSNLVPIWALAAVSVMKQNAAATGNSTIPKSTTGMNKRNGMSSNTGTSTITQQYQQQQYTTSKMSSSTSTSTSIPQSSNLTMPPPPPPSLPPPARGTTRGTSTTASTGGNMPSSMQRSLYPSSPHSNVNVNAMNSSNSNNARFNFEIGYGMYFKQHVSSIGTGAGTGTGTGTNVKSGGGGGGGGGGIISKSEFSQEKKWVRSGNKWVLTGTSSHGYGLHGIHGHGLGYNDNYGHMNANRNISSSSILAEMGSSLPTVPSTESSDAAAAAGNTATSGSAFHSHAPAHTHMYNRQRKQLQQKQQFTKPSTVSSSSSSLSLSTTKTSNTTANSTAPTSVSPSWRHHSRSSTNATLSVSSNVSPSYKANPTAVSSYGTTSFSKPYSSIHTSPSRSPSSSTTPPSSYYNHNPNTNNNNNTNNTYYNGIGNVKYENSTSTSSVISSSPSLLYTRRRLATTSSGFPYMPSLHLTRSSSSCGGTGVNANTAAAGGNNKSSGGNSSSLRINTASSVLFRNKKSSSGIISGIGTSPSAGPSTGKSSSGKTMNSASTGRSSGNDRLGIAGLGGNDHAVQSLFTSSSTMSLIQQQQQQQQHLSKPQSVSHNDLDFSGYDSESNIGERLKEWKKKYVQNVIEDDNGIGSGSGSGSKDNIHVDRNKDLNMEKDGDNSKIIRSNQNTQSKQKKEKARTSRMMKIETNQNISSITNDNDPYHDPLSELLQEEDILEEQVQRQLKESTVLARKSTISSTKQTIKSSPHKISYNSRALSDSLRSIDLGYDSESNNIMERLKEWKKEQYKKSGVVIDQSAVRRKKHRRKKSVSEGVGAVSSSITASPLSRIKSISRNQSDSPLYAVDSGYESGSTTCDNERLKEWKEQQYEISGIIRNQVPTASKVSGNGSNWDLPMTRSLDSYDSEEPNSREERLKEWKQQFVNLPMQEKNNDLEFTINEKDALTTIHSAPGFFPVTSPGRKKGRNGSKRQTSSGLPPNPSPKPSPSPVSPPPSVRRDYARSIGTGNLPKQPALSSSLPPLTPPRIQTKTAPCTVSNTKNKNDTTTEDAKTAHQSKTQAVSNAAKFLFNLAQPMSSSFVSSKNQEGEDKKTASNVASILCSPDSGNINTPCQVIPKLPSADSAMELESSPQSNSNKSISQQLLRSVDLWKPNHSQSSFSAISGGDHDSNCSLNPHDSCSYLPFHGNRKKSQKEVLPEPLLSWENCLHVRAEGARTGRICLSSTHLIFIYEDDTAEAALFENGWSQNKIHDFLQIVSGSPVRGATPINVPPDESGEGGGVELIGTDENGIDFFDMLEDGFKENKSVSLTEEEKENLTDGALSFDEIKCEVVKNQSVSSSGLHVNYGDAQSNIIKEDTSTEGESDIKVVMKSNQHEENVVMNEIPQTCMSMSSSYSSCLSDDSLTKDETTTSGPESSLCEDSYEYMLNECIVRAMKAEAHRRLTELGGDDSAVMSSTASYSTWDKLEINQADTNNDFGSLLGNQTNVSSFSEPDLDIDLDEERQLYISEAKDLKNRFVGMKWPLCKLAELYDRRYMTREVALEIFSPSPSPSTTQSIRRPSSAASVSTAGGFTIEELDVPLGPLSKDSIFLVVPDTQGTETDEQVLNRFGRAKKKKSRRDSFVDTLRDHASNLNDVHWQNAKTLNRLWVAGNVAAATNEDKRSWTPTSLFRRRHSKSDALYLLTRAWRKGLVSNYDYLLRLNAISGRSFHDPGNYPVMPWVLSNFLSTSVPDLSDERNYRDLTKPMGALYPERLNKFLEKYTSLCNVDYAIPPFMYGSHYSNTGGVVLHYLVRKRPFAGLHRQLQGGQFDIPDRLFRSVSQTWEICSRKSATEVKELTPEWYSDATFLRNEHGFNLGTSVDGATISDVILPPWANSDASKFIEVMRNALESDHCSAKLPSWIDLIFGYKQRGPEAEKANNVFYHLSYYDSEDLNKVEDKTLRAEIELHIADFGNCPSQLFFEPHRNKKAESLVTQSKGELRVVTGATQKDMSLSTPRRILISHD